MELGHGGRPRRQKVTALRTAGRGALWGVRHSRDCDADAPDVNEMYRVDLLGKIHSSRDLSAHRGSSVGSAEIDGQSVFGVESVARVAVRAAAPWPSIPRPRSESGEW